MRLLVGTGNQGKFIEIGEALRSPGLELVLAEASQVRAMPPEEGVTFADNALLKARYYAKQSGLPTIADDSGIIVDALKDELGIHTRRWGAGAAASDSEWITYFLRRLEREKNRHARFVCAIAYVDPKSRAHVFEGTCTGVITPTLEAAYLPGLPISACFKPKGYDRVYAALSIEEKNSVSHRGRALQKLASHLASHS